MKRFTVITLFPEIVEAYAGESILKRAAAKKLLALSAVQLRDFAMDKHRHVDDRPFGGGPGMVLMVEPIDRALKKSLGKKPKKARVILTSARGKVFTQADARRLATYDHVVFVCGRYEGVDERVAEHLVDEEFSIGPYVLTGGELPALVMTDAIARQVPGVLGKGESLEEIHGSFPQYTRPEKYRKWNVPPVLLSGDHKKIDAWRRAQRMTEALRPERASSAGERRKPK